MLSELLIDTIGQAEEEILEIDTENDKNIIESNILSDIIDDSKLEELQNKISTLPFMKAVYYRKYLHYQLKNLDNMKATLDSLNEFKESMDTTIKNEIGDNDDFMKAIYGNEEDVSKKIDDTNNIDNSLEKIDLDKSAEDIYNNYDKYVENINKVINILNDHINEYKDVAQSTSFLTNELISMLNNKLNELNPNGLNYEYNKNKILKIIDMYNNRLSLDYIDSKLDNFLLINKKYLNKVFDKKEISLMLSGRRNKIINKLYAIYGRNIIQGVFATLYKIFDNDILETYLFLAYLLKLLETSKKTSDDNWIKIFILNISDINNNIFDIGDGQEYLNTVDNVFHERIKKYFDSNKIRLSK